jgi:hypothetical protein
MRKRRVFTAKASFVLLSLLVALRGIGRKRFTTFVGKSAQQIVNQLL